VKPFTVHAVDGSNPDLARVLRSATMRRAVHAAAEAVARAVEDQGQRVGNFKGGEHVDIPVEVVDSVSDRARSTVLLAHPAGSAAPAKHGLLPKGAAATGLTPKAYR